MVELSQIEKYLAKTLNTADIRDYLPHGVQVRGRPQVKRVVTGVSACMELFEKALDHEADLIIVHHGMFWKNEPRVVEGMVKNRLKFLLDHDLTLMGFHLPLDCHPTLGNNAQILSRLQLTPGLPFGRYDGLPLSSLGLLPTPKTFSSFLADIKRVFGGEPLSLPFGPEMIKTVAVVSGNAPDLLREAKEAGADLFLTGEGTEYVYHYAREEKINFIAAGHHRTEKFGVQALGEQLVRKFAIDHQFIDIANPL